MAARALALSFLFIGLIAGPARAQLQITPNVDVTPTSATTPWIVYMAIAAAVLGLLILLALLAGYMRFGPKFFGREASPPPPRPGQRPPELARQAAAIRPPAATPAPAPAPAPAATPAPAQAATPAPAPAEATSAVAVAERPAPEATSAPSTAAEASTVSTAGPGGEPAAQADAVGEAEAAAPEPRPTAKTPEEVGAAPAAEAPAAQPAAEAPAAQPAAEAPAAQPAAAAAPASRGAAGMDQETFDRVLQEQLDKGVDRRVAEGRARAAAVVAARKKEQG